MATVGSEVRRIRPDEWREYKRLRLEALQDSPLAFVEQYDESSTKDDQFWRDRAARGAAGDASVLFVALDADEFVGKAGCFPEPDGGAHVVGVYVTPRRRGTDVAETLVLAAVEWAQQAWSAQRIRLFVAGPNDRATAFYRRLGFVATGTTEPYPPDPSLVEYEMEYRPTTR
jgi:ribosomal protein S18 acetylase RimI-like enzyme